MLFLRGYNFKISVGVNFRGCCISCIFEIKIVFKVIMETMQISSVIRGHHIYKEVWELIHGQILQCTREKSNRFDPCAVSIINSEEVVGHVPRRISAAYALCSCSIMDQLGVKLQAIEGIPVIFRKKL